MHLKCILRHSGSPLPLHIAKSPTNLCITCLLSIVVRVLGLFEVTHSICAVLQGVDGRGTKEAVEHLVMVPLLVLHSQT